MLIAGTLIAGALVARVFGSRQHTVGLHPVMSTAEHLQVLCRGLPVRPRHMMVSITTLRGDGTARCPAGAIAKAQRIAEHPGNEPSGVDVREHVKLDSGDAARAIATWVRFAGRFAERLPGRFAERLPGGEGISAGVLPGSSRG